MHVVVNAISAHKGGIVTYTRNLARYLSRAGVSGEIFVPTDFPGGDISDRMAMRRTVAGHYNYIRRFVWEQTVWPRVVAGCGADILFSSGNYGVLRTRVPQVLLVQGEISFNAVYRDRILPRLSAREQAAFALRRRLVLRSARAADLVIFPSRTAMESVLESDPSLAGRSVVSYLGAGEEFLSFDHARPWRQDGRLRLLYISIYYPHKDPLTLQRAVGRLRSRGIETEARISMDPSDFENWSTGPAELGAMRIAERTGPVKMGRIHHTQVLEALAGHDVLVSSSMAETFGFPLVEAMACGIPLVVADTPVHREICGDAALFFAPGSSYELAERVLELDADPSARARYRERGRALARAHFTWDRHMSALVEGFRRAAR